MIPRYENETLLRLAAGVFRWSPSPVRANRARPSLLETDFPTSHTFRWKTQILEEGPDVIPVEIKSRQTIATDYLNGLKKWRELSGVPERPAMLVYGGSAAHTANNVAIVPWQQLPGRV